MKLPVLEELILTNFEADNIRERLQRFNAGKVPLFLILNDDNSDQLLLKLSLLKEEMDTLGIDSKIPYPIYVVSPLLAHHDDFIVVSSPKELPKHFTKPSKRLNNKETAKLSKSDLLSDKIINSSPQDIMASLLERKYKMRTIKALTAETLFLESLARELKRSRASEGRKF